MLDQQGSVVREESKMTCQGADFYLLAIAQEQWTSSVNKYVLPAARQHVSECSACRLQMEMYRNHLDIDPESARIASLLDCEINDEELDLAYRQLLETLSPEDRAKHEARVERNRQELRDLVRDDQARKLYN
jgi:hypothetical protein